MNRRFSFFILLPYFTILAKFVVSDILIYNKKQSGKVMKTIQPSGISMCAKYCFCEKRCQSFNFERETLSCEMLPTEDPSLYIDTAGYLHSGIRKWSKDLTVSCGINYCSVEERCVPLQNGKEACINIGCIGVGYTYEDAADLCYHIFQERKTWTNASEYCQSEGGRLIVLDTPEKVKYFPPSGYKTVYIYIGLTDSEIEGTFKWVSGSTLKEHKWKPIEPNDDHILHPNKSADCVSTFGDSWVDIYCQHQYRFACERPDLSLKNLKNKIYIDSFKSKHELNLIGHEMINVNNTHNTK